MGCPSAWLMRNRLIIELRTPKIGAGWVPEVPCRAHEVKKTHVQHCFFLGGWLNGNSVGLDPGKGILGCPSAWLMGIRLIIEFSPFKLGGMGT